MVHQRNEGIQKTWNHVQRERSKALKAYRDYIKTHPGIVANTDIDRRQWER